MPSMTKGERLELAQLIRKREKVMGDAIDATEDQLRCLAPPTADASPRRMDKPECGYWLVRQIKGGPRTPASIQVVHTLYEPGEAGNRMERSPFLAAFIAGEPVALDEVWLRRGDPITKEDYEFRVADLRWSREHAPDEPQANPRKAVDLLQATLPF